MTPKLIFPPPEIVVDTREQVTLYDTNTGEEYDGDRDEFVYFKENNLDFARAATGELYVCQSRGAYEFKDYNTHRAKLAFGDYALRGYETLNPVERKTLPDFVFTITVAHDRFMREIERARAAKSNLCIVVEGTLDDIIRERYITPTHRMRMEMANKKTVHANAVLGAMYRLNDLCVPVHLCGNRKLANDFTLGILLQKHADMREVWMARNKF